MLVKLEEDKNYSNKIYEAIKNINKIEFYEILKSLDISLTDNATYDNVLKYIDRLFFDLEKIKGGN